MITSNENSCYNVEVTITIQILIVTIVPKYRWYKIEMKEGSRL